MEQEYQKKRAEQAKIAAEKQKELIATISVNFATTLCDYGASLRELKDNEFVSLQLSNSHGRNSQDIYWVFKKSDINQCVTGKLNSYFITRNCFSPNSNWLISLQHHIARKKCCHRQLTDGNIGK